jgi:N-formylglutamate deformylase
MNDDTFTLSRGTAPLLVSLPHVGTRIPSELRPRFVERALEVEDTDWHLDRLYSFARDLGAGLIVPRYSRYVIDLNRPPENRPMYAGANNTELCPTRFFTGDALYRDGQAPVDAEVQARLARYWHPYHSAISEELARLRGQHGYAVLWEGHSIKSVIPWLFDGRLPDLNLGTANGASCAGSLRSALMQVLAAQDRFSHATDGRFRGGHITRHFGRPRDGIHAAQLEMCWSTYMDERPPFEVDPDRAGHLAPVLRSLLQAALDWRPDVA